MPADPHPARSGPTGAGWATLAGTAVLLAAGLAAGYPVLAGIGLAGVAVLVVATLAALVPARLDAERVVTPDRIAVGEPTLARLSVGNAGRFAAPGFDAVERIDGRPLRVPVPALHPGERRVLHYPVPGIRRGLVRLGPVVVDRRDPLGLVRRVAPLAGDTRLWVHPRTRAARPLPVGAVPDFEGRLPQQVTRGSTAFSSLREYQPGDDPRQIHWRSTARTGTLVVREHVDTDEPMIALVLDTRADALPVELFEAAVEVAASVAVASERVGQRVTLLAPGERREEVADAGGHTVLDRLAAVTTRRGTLTDLVRTVESAPGGGALLVVAGPDAELPARLAPYRRRYGRAVLVALDEATAGPFTAHRAGLTVVRAATAETALAGWDRVAGRTR